MDVSLLMAIGPFESQWGRSRLFGRVLAKESNGDDGAEAMLDIMKKLDVVHDVHNLFQRYKDRAYSVLSALDNANLKCVLHRVIGKIFCDIKKMGCCNDDWTGNASSRETRRG